jgi:hypothetical protein
MIKAIELEHVTVRRDGTRVPVLLQAYKKKGAYKVSKGPNVVSAEVSCNTLDDVAAYIGKGYMVRMQSDIMEIDGKRRRINGLYGSSEARIVR